MYWNYGYSVIIGITYKNPHNNLFVPQHTYFRMLQHSFVSTSCKYTIIKLLTKMAENCKQKPTETDWLMPLKTKQIWKNKIKIPKHFKNTLTQEIKVTKDSCTTHPSTPSKTWCENEFHASHHWSFLTESQRTETTNTIKHHSHRMSSS